MFNKELLLTNTKYVNFNNMFPYVLQYIDTSVWEVGHAKRRAARLREGKPQLPGTADKPA